MKVAPAYFNLKLLAVTVTPRGPRVPWRVIPFIYGDSY
jgi:hypothetical protein